MREFSVPPIAMIAPGANLTDPVWDNAENYPDTPQFAHRSESSTGTETGKGTETGWRDTTCAEFRDEVVAVARGLIAAGVEPGDRVAVMSKTRYEWTLLDYAIWTAGGVGVPIYETSSAEQVQWILSDSEAVACVVETAEHRATVDTVTDRTPTLRWIWQIEPTASLPGAVPELVELGRALPAERVAQRRASRRADHLATIIYTSGTTGRPKGCMLTHRNMLTDISNAIPGLPHIFRPQASTLIFLPLAHGFARLIQVGVVQGRVRTAFAPDVRNLASDLADFRPTFVLAVPRVFEKVYNSARQRAYADGKGAIFDRAAKVATQYSEALDRPGGPGVWLRARHALFDRLVYAKLRAALGGRCTDAICGGAPLGRRLAHFFRGIKVTVYEGYGLTETSPACAVNLVGHTRIGTVGRPLPGVSIRVDDDAEIAVRGDLVFAGYWRNADATAEAIDSEGWFRTGDLGHLDDDGYLTITGRTKELIVTAGGKNVAPAVLEDHIRAHALVSQCMLIGDRQPFIAALITLDEDGLSAWKANHRKPAQADPALLRGDPELLESLQRIVDEANQTVSRAESIRVFRVLSSDFTEANGMLTPSLKVKRTVVAKEYADEIAAIYV